MTLALIYVFSAILFLLLLISLGFQPRFLSRITGALLLVIGAAGTLLYGYGFFKLFGNVPQAVMRTLFSVFCMFLGRNEISAISAVPALAVPGMQIIIYTVHLLALYCTASAVIAAMGTRLLRTLHLLLIRRGELHLIFGANEDSLSFGCELMKKKSDVVVFVDQDASLDSAILRSGSLLFSDADAVAPTDAFLRRIGLNNAHRRLTLYCLSDETSENLRYASAMAEALSRVGADEARSALTILLEDERQGSALQTSAEHSGFGSVLALPRRDLTARLMIQAASPWETMRFDADGRAAEDFEALIVGFGRTGQAALRALIMNGQFAGSRFHAVVVARDSDEFSGDFDLTCPELKSSYDIRFINGNAHSTQVYRHLTNCAANLNYVAVCTGSDKENEEIAAEYSFTPDILCSRRLDAMAMVINHQYHRAEGRSMEEDWAGCDYFSRMSCRASADFLPAFLQAAGLSARDVTQKDFCFAPDILENLSETEHMRWCAFHRVMGYRRMPKELFRRRAEQLLRETEQTGASALRPGKDAQQLLHACLVPWEELNALSELEHTLTGRTVDYQEMDRDNVRMIPAMLRAEEGHE